MTLNDHTMETDEPVCVLICLDVYVAFQEQKLVKNKQNKTKYTMDPGIYYSLEADEDNTNSY